MTQALLNHEVTGAGRQLGLLLLHPLGGDLRYWDACIAIWRDRISCVAVDLRNAAGPQRLPVTLEQHAEDLERLRAVLGFERLVPIGSAVSTMIAACYAALHPARTQALILASATARSSPAACEMLIARAAAVRADGLAAILPQAVERAFLNQPHDERYRHYYEAFARQPPDDYALACQAAAHYDAEPYLTQVRCPSLVVSSAHDVLLPPALGRDVARLIPGAEFQVMPDAAHFAPYQAPEAFASLVLRFLDAAAVAPTARSG